MPKQNPLLEIFDKETADKLKDRKTIPYGVPDIEFLPTGIYMMDWALGGGLAKSRISEISGWPGSGKTTTCLIIAQHVIQQGGRVAWFEAEEALDPNWMQELGIPYEEIYWDESCSLKDTHFHIFHPPYLEKGLEDIRIIAPSNVYDLIIYDSIGGSPTLAAYEADIEKNQMMITARVLGRFLSVMPQDVKRGKAAVLFTNQVYNNPNQTHPDALLPYGGTVVAKGGGGIAFLSTARMMTYMPKIVKDSADINIGKQIKARVYKNKVLGGIQRDFTYNIMHDPKYYIDIPQDIIDTANLFDLFEKAGSWYTINGESIQGDKKLKERLSTDSEFTIRLISQLENNIREIHKNKRPMSNVPMIETFEETIDEQT